MTVRDWLGENNQIGIDIWEKKYRYKNETFEEWLDRISNRNEELKQLIREKKFLFGGRVLSNRGLKRKASLFNCYSRGYIEDDFLDIMQANTDIALTYKYQGGQGLSLTKLRPKGTGISNEYQSDGIIPFIKMYNATTEAVTQGGSRKGALMISLDCRHKEVEDFIKLKSNLTEVQKANLSLEVDDEFMRTVIQDYKNDTETIIHESRNYEGHEVEYDIIPIKIFNLLCQNSYDWGDPAVLFTKEFRNYNLMEFCDDYEIETSNPCVSGDTLVATENGYKCAKDITINDNLITTIGIEPIKTIEINKDMPVYEIKLDNGMKIKVTKAHQFQAAKKHFLPDTYDFIELKYLKVGDYIRITTDYFYEQVNEQSLLFDKSQINFKLVKIESINYIGNETVYDFYCEESDTWITNGFVSRGCGEQPLPKNFNCNLCSLNLAEFVIDKFTSQAKFDFLDFKRAIKIAIRASDELVDENKDNHPLKEQSINSLNYRNLGLGVFGYADMLIMLGLEYGSPAALDFTDTLFKEMFQEAVLTSQDLAEEKGPFPKFSYDVYESRIIKYHLEDVAKVPLRNCSLLSIAPTGTLSTMLGRAGGCEPLFALSYNRRTESLNNGEDKTYRINCLTLQEYYDKMGESEIIPDYFVTANDIDWRDRIDTQAVIQNHIDTAISSTINLPKDTPLEDIKSLYIYAWAKNLKGVTIFRNGCKKGGVLTLDEEKKTDKFDLGYDIELDSITPITRNEMGDALEGTTYIKEVACGKLYLTINHNENKEIVEVFMSTGKSGGCSANAESLGRLASLACRGGVSIDAIVDATRGVVCGACKQVKGQKTKYIDGISCGDVLANTIRDEYEKLMDSKEHGAHKTVVKTIEPSYTIPIRSPIGPAATDHCPECGEALRQESGCNVCSSCGYSKCS